jgi:septal ring factor EnvC (AmiA/AmiB activator)
MLTRSFSDAAAVAYKNGLGAKIDWTAWLGAASVLAGCTTYVVTSSVNATVDKGIASVHTRINHVENALHQVENAFNARMNELERNVHDLRKEVATTQDHILDVKRTVRGIEEKLLKLLEK